MNLPELIAFVESPLRRPLAVLLPPVSLSKVYSKGRKIFLHALVNNPPKSQIEIPPVYAKKLWDIKFNSPLFNAAGMFKTGKGYQTASKQGAGAFLVGTTTSPALPGNKKLGVRHPFMPYPHTGAASNWMGLPNDGHESVAKILSSITKINGCPIGASLALNPRQNEDSALKLLVEGLSVYNKAGADFIEINESCPNVDHALCVPDESGIDKNLIRRLTYIKDNFLSKRNRNLPVIVKFSNDTLPEQVPALLNLLIEFGFDGVNFGNTSIDYERYIEMLNPRDLINFEFFTRSFGGGLSGSILKGASLELSKSASESLALLKPAREFHLIRTGGIESYEDVLQSEKAGAGLNQWFTGYFEAFSKCGNNLYKNIFGSK